MLLGVGKMATATSTELTDAQWQLLLPLLPPKATTGRPRADDRRTLNGILWVLRTGARWADMPREYGAPSTAHVRLQTWAKHEQRPAFALRCFELRKWIVLHGHALLH